MVIHPTDVEGCMCEQNIDICINPVHISKGFSVYNFSL